MTLTPRLRKFMLTAHVTSAVGWLGAVVAYLALAIAGLTSQDSQVVRAAYLAMELIGWFVIVPFCLASLLTGLVQALGTEWGLLRHYWILVKFFLTIGATIVLLLHMPAVSHMSGAAAESILSGSDLRAQRIQLVVHAGGGLFVLLGATTLSVYKPWGRIRYRQRKQDERREVARADHSAPPASVHRGDTHVADPSSQGDTKSFTGVRPDPGSTTRTPLRYVLLGIGGLVLLFVLLHLAGGGMGRH